MSFEYFVKYTSSLNMKALNCKIYVNEMMKRGLSHIERSRRLTICVLE